MVSRHSLVPGLAVGRLLVIQPNPPVGMSISRAPSLRTNCRGSGESVFGEVADRFEAQRGGIEVKRSLPVCRGKADDDGREIGSK